MGYAVVMGVMIAVLAVKAFAMFSLGKLEKEVSDLRAEDKEVKGKLDALDSTRTQLERDHKDILSDIEKLENTKNQLVVSIQKFGAAPVQEPSIRENAPADPSDAPTQDGGPHEEETDAGEAARDIAESGEEEETEEQEATREAVDGEGPGPESDDATVAVDEADDRVRLLIVDDNTELRDLLTEALSRTYAVDGAADGLEALHLMLKVGRSYAVVLTDLNMPNIDGMTLINKMPEDTRVIVMSAYLDRPEFNGVAEHPAVVQTIGKPFRLGEVRDAVARLVEEEDPTEATPVPKEDVVTETDKQLQG